MTRHFLLFFVPAGILVILAAFGLDRYLFSVQMKALMQEQERVVAFQLDAVQAQLSAHAMDASFLAAVAGEMSQAGGRTGFDAKSLTPLLWRFSLDKPSYRQVRLLDAQGMEVIRINNTVNGPAAVEPDKLQDKSSRDFFVQGVRSCPGGVYVSRFDLNMEHGKVEEPYAPIICFASPVESPGGGAIGLVVVNYNAGELLRRLRLASTLTSGELHLTDMDGNWLLHPDRDMEWNAMFPERSTPTACKTYSAAWEKMRQRQGQFVTDQGLFTYARLDMREGVQRRSSQCSEEAEPRRLLLFSRVSDSGLTPYSKGVYSGIVVVLLAVLAVVAFWGAYFRHKNQMTQKAAEQEAKRVAAMSESMHDALVMINPQGQVIFWNESAEEMFGYSSQEAMGKDVHELIAPVEFRPGAEDGMDVFRRTGKGSAVGNILEYEGLCKDGTRFPLERSVASFQLDEGWCAAATLRDITERKNMERQLVRMATIDEMTGVCNRRHFMVVMLREMERAKRYGYPLSLIMFDADHFKYVNDGYGHDVGDEVLRQLANAMRATMREVDASGRLGGEEFAVLLPQIGLEDAHVAAERLRTAVGSLVVPTEKGDLGVTISLGVVTMTEGDDMESMLKRVDQALYRAKDGGRNRTEQG